MKNGKGFKGWADTAEEILEDVSLSHTPVIISNRKGSQLRKRNSSRKLSTYTNSQNNSKSWKKKREKRMRR